MHQSLREKLRGCSNTGVLSSFITPDALIDEPALRAHHAPRALPPGEGLSLGLVCIERGFKAINGISCTEVLDFTTEPGRPGSIEIAVQRQIAL
jgi:hypothetical protein